MFARLFRDYLPEEAVLPAMQSDDYILIKIWIWSTQTYGYYYTPRNMPVNLIMEVHCRQWELFLRTMNLIVVNILFCLTNFSILQTFFVPHAITLCGSFTALRDSFRAQRLTYEGRMIQENDTPASLGMQDCDTIDIVYAQAAG